MAGGAADLKGWRIATSEEVARWEEEARREQEEFDKRWPVSQRRKRCENCGAFMAKSATWWTRCKRCDESCESQQ